MNQLKEYYNKEIAMLTESKNKMKESVVSFSMAVKKLKKDLTTSQEKNNELVEAEHKWNQERSNYMEKHQTFRMENNKLMVEIQRLKRELEQTSLEYQETKSMYLINYGLPNYYRQTGRSNSRNKNGKRCP